VSHVVRVFRPRSVLIVLCGIIALLSSSNQRVEGESQQVAAWSFSDGCGSIPVDETGNGDAATLDGATWTSSQA
jgi:hypothetical protein